LARDAILEVSPPLRHGHSCEYGAFGAIEMRTTAGLSRRNARESRGNIVAFTSLRAMSSLGFFGASSTCSAHSRERVQALEKGNSFCKSSIVIPIQTSNVSFILSIRSSSVCATSHSKCECPKSKQLCELLHCIRDSMRQRYLCKRLQIVLSHYCHSKTWLDSIRR
jgi:hypothetical protein